MTTTMNLIVDSGEGSVCDKSGKDSGETIDVESPMAPFIPSNNLCVPTKKRTPSECSHKVIEKRRRDRINKCLAELAHIVPKAQGTGKLEKAEVLELTVEYIKKLQNSANSSPSTNVESENQTTSQEKEQPTSCTKRELQSYSKGYSDCTNEVLHFMITVEATDPQLPCFQRLMAHLRNNCRLLVDFEKKNSPSTLDSAAAIKHRGQNKRNLPNTEGQTGVLKAKRVRNKTDDSPSSSTAPSGNSSDDPKPPPSISGMTLEDKMKAVFKNGNSGIEGSASPYNGNNGINRSGNNGDKGNPNVGCSPYPHGNLLPFPNHGYLPSYGFPSYALLPTSAQYIPVPIHPGLAGNNLGGPMLSAPFMPHGFGGYLGSPMPGMSTGLPLGNFSNILGGTLPSYGGLLSGMVGGLSGFKGAEGLPAHLAREKTKEPNQERAQDSSGSSENGSSGDEYNFSTTSSSNLSDVGIQTDQPNDHSDYYSAGSR